MITISNEQLIEFACLGIRANALATQQRPTAEATMAAARITAKQPAFRAVVEAAAHFGWTNAAPVVPAPRRKRPEPIPGQHPLFEVV